MCLRCPPRFIVPYLCVGESYCESFCPFFFALDYVNDLKYCERKYVRKLPRRRLRRLCEEIPLVQQFSDVSHRKLHTEELLRRVRVEIQRYIYEFSNSVINLSLYDSLSSIHTYIVWQIPLLGQRYWQKRLEWQPKIFHAHANFPSTKASYIHKY